MSELLIWEWVFDSFTINRWRGDKTRELKDAGDLCANWWASNVHNIPSGATTRELLLKGHVLRVGTKCKRRHLPRVLINLFNEEDGKISGNLHFKKSILGEAIRSGEPWEMICFLLRKNSLAWKIIWWENLRKIFPLKNVHLVCFLISPRIEYWTSSFDSLGNCIWSIQRLKTSLMPFFIFFGKINK